MDMDMYLKIAMNIVVNNEAWMLQYHKNVEPFFKKEGWENNCKASMISAKQILYYLRKSIYLDYSTHAESRIHTGNFR